MSRPTNLGFRAPDQHSGDNYNVLVNKEGKHYNIAASKQNPKGTNLP